MKYFLISILFINYTLASAAKLMLWNDIAKEFKQFCSASFFSPSFMVTAAHCVKGFHKGEFFIISDAGNSFNVSNIISHKFYTPHFQRDQFDFALLKVSNLRKLAPIGKVFIGQELIFKGVKGIVTQVYISEFKVSFKNGELCLGDSGSTIRNIKGENLGILSRGDPVCNKFGIFTKMSYIQAWANGNLNLNQEYKKIKKKFIDSLQDSIRSRNDKRNKIR